MNKENPMSKKMKEKIASVFDQMEIGDEYTDEIVNFSLNNEVYNPNFNTQQITLDNSTEAVK